MISLELARLSAGPSSRLRRMPRYCRTCPASVPSRASNSPTKIFARVDSVSTGPFALFR